MADFKSSFEELQSVVADFDIPGRWSDVANGKQFKANDGGILNWFPATGRINFQGPSAAREKLQQCFGEPSLPTVSTPSAPLAAGGKPQQKVFVVHGHDTVAREQLKVDPSVKTIMHRV